MFQRKTKKKKKKKKKRTKEEVIASHSRKGKKDRGGREDLETNTFRRTAAELKEAESG